MKKELQELISSDQFGEGSVTPVAYSTAWVARIKNKCGTSPAFPESLEYLRKIQNSDGSWGTEYPFLIYDRIISTLVSIICLKQWNDPQDITRMNSGYDFLKNNINKLNDDESIKNKMTVGFELLFPALMDEASSFGLEFESNCIATKYRIERKHNLNEMMAFQCNRTSSELRPWYYTLEGWSAIYFDRKLHSIKDMTENGLICGSYSATAYLLYKGFCLEKGYEMIREVVGKNNGGVPPVHKRDIFYLASSLNSLLFSGFPMDVCSLHSVIDRLHIIWIDNEATTDRSTIGRPLDANEISDSIVILSETKRVCGKEWIQSLLKYWGGNYFITSEAEVHPSLATNINCLNALGYYGDVSYDDQDIQHIIEETCIWTKTAIIENDFKFDDKWHYSKYYVMSKALIAFMKFDREFSGKIFTLLLEQQNEDGGWGMDNVSSRLESSYAIISIVYWLKSMDEPMDSRMKEVLINAKKFMDLEECGCSYKFWKDKTLYSPINIDSVSILSSKYSLNQLISSSE